MNHDSELWQLIAGYLCEDFEMWGGGPQEAIESFLDHSSAAELANLAADIKRFLDEHQSEAEVRTALLEEGIGVHPPEPGGYIALLGSIAHQARHRLEVNKD